MLYDMPADIREKEKIVGGLFTLTQFIFLVIAAVLGIGSVLILQSLTSNLIFSLIVGIILAAPFMPFSFVKIRKYGDIELFNFVLIKLRFRHEIKKYTNINENYGGD